MSPLWSVVHSLKFRLTVGGVVALAVAVSIVALLLVQQTERDTLVGERQRQVSEAARVAKVLARRVVELQRALRVTADQLTPEILQDRDRLTAFTRAQPVLNAMFSSVFVVGPDGRMLALEQGDRLTFPGTDLRDRDYIRETLDKGAPVISGTIISRVSGRPMLSFSQPLVRNGQTYGVLAGSLNLDSRDLLADVVDDDQSGALIAVTDLQGKLLAHPVRSAVLTPIAAQPRFGEAFAAWTSMGAAAEPEGLGLPQESDIVSACGVIGTDWMVWRASPKSDLLAPLRAARTHALKLVGTLLLLASLTVFGLLAWALRPLRQLSARALHLFDGTQDPAAGWPSARGELGQLTQALRQAVVERIQYQALNEEMLKRLSTVMAAAPIGIAFTRHQKFELVSAELCRLLGRPEADLLGNHVSLIYPEYDDFLRTAEMLEASLLRGEPYQGEWKLSRADGTTFWAQLRGCAMDDSRASAGVIWTFSDVTAQVASREKLEWASTHDALTGLANRMLLDHKLRGLFGEQGARGWSALVVIDLDNFKPVNDLGGHAAGDEMLKLVAVAIRKCVREVDLVARTGGDEFALVLEGCPTATAVRIAEKIRDAIGAARVEANGRTLQVGASLGISQLGANTRSVEAWMDDADQNCYAAKRAGRNTVSIRGDVADHRVTA